MIYLPSPTAIHSDVKRNKRLREAARLELLDVAGYRVSVEVIPFEQTVEVSSGQGIKVLWGKVHDGDKHRSSFSVPTFTASSTRVSSGQITAGPIGAIILRFNPIKSFDYSTEDIDDYVSVNNVPVRTLCRPAAVEPMSLQFKKVDTLAWGSGFKGVDFHNLSGFHFSFLETKELVAHLQFWTAGANVNCGVHNHADELFQEVHVCLSPGTGDGGMWRLKEGVKVENLNELGPESFDQLPLGRLEEHGGLWQRDSYGKAVRAADGSVQYPYHKWQSGQGQNVDVWAAIEFNPDLVEPVVRGAASQPMKLCC